MIDFLEGFFVAIRFSFRALASPATDKLTRRLQLCSLVFCLTGIGLSVWAVVEFVVSKIGETLWLYLAFATLACWAVGVITGGIAESREEACGDGTP